MRPLATALAAASLVFTLAPAAHAVPPDDVELGLRTGLITRPSGNAGSPVALGLGVRLGGMISGFYFGLSVINYWGGSQSAGPPPGESLPGASTSSGTVGSEYLLYGLELGYSISLFNERLTLRPQLGGGLGKTTYTCGATSGSASAALVCGDDHTYGPYLEPGVTALVPLGRILFVGLDANLLLLIDSGTVSPALTMHAQLGLRF